MKLESLAGGRWFRFALLVVLCASIGCRGPEDEEVETESVVSVVAEAARVGTVRAVIHATGLVSPAPGAELIVTAPEAGRIVEMPKAEGDRVRSGDVLVRFEIPSLAAEAERSRAAVRAAEARAQIAETAHGRAQELFDRGVAARREVEDADRELSEARAALEQARAGFEASQTLASRATVHATFDGIVARRTHNPGDLVEASAGDPVLRVIDPGRLEVQASVPIADLSRIVIGARAHITVASDAEPLALQVVSRPAAVEPGTAAAPVRLAFVASTQLAAGTPVQVDIDAEEHAGVVLVPAAAVLYEGGEASVFIAAGDKAQRRIVQTGLSDASFVELRSGVLAGELVITRGQNGLPDGASIALGETTPARDTAPAGE